MKQYKLNCLILSVLEINLLQINAINTWYPIKDYYKYLVILWLILIVFNWIIYCILLIIIDNICINLL